MILTDDQRAVRDMAREFAQNELAPHAGAWDKASALPDAIVEQMGALGLLGMVVPEEWGGSYTDYVAYALAVEEIAAGCASCSTLMSVHSSTRLSAARLLTLHAAALRTQGVACLSEASQAKLYASEMAEFVCSKAIQIHGGYGFLEDYPVERYYRDARVTQIYEGTSEVQRMLIARSL